MDKARRANDLAGGALQRVSLKPFYSLGSSLDPTIVRFMPTWTLTDFSPTLRFVLPVKYQPSEPVENSFTSAVIGIPLMTTSTGWAFSRNSPRVTEQEGFAMISSNEVEGGEIVSLP